MLPRRPALIAAVAALALAACQSRSTADSGALAIPRLEPQARTLVNGLRVYALPDPGTASVSVAVWYDVGSKNVRLAVRVSRTSSNT